ncbi:hypothetical protein Celaphus_00019175 [Cervus elaphus hippelaphus]|uniref:Uncharacterized protein n=1 Tax=Cervus elaphus hippelaphus TaxID=46360 RepID=A0A212C7E7_CEREH|nr:hypothetical protein Celaphus_00019175 [Cervus elaphus hippelaphus]
MSTPKRVPVQMKMTWKGILSLMTLFLNQKQRTVGEVNPVSKQEALHRSLMRPP